MVDNIGEITTKIDPEKNNTTPINTESQTSDSETEPNSDSPSEPISESDNSSDINKPKEISIKRDVFVHENQFVSQFLGQLLQNPQNYEFKNDQNLSSEEKIILQNQMKGLVDKLMKKEKLTSDDLMVLDKVNFNWRVNEETQDNNNQTENMAAKRLEKTVSMQTLLTFYCGEEATSRLEMSEQSINILESTRNEVLKAAADFGLLTVDNNALETFPELFENLTKNLISPEFMSGPLQKMQMALRGRLILTPTDFQTLALQLEQDVNTVLEKHPESKKEAKKSQTMTRNEYQQQLKSQISYFEQQLNSTTDEHQEQVLSEKIRYCQSILEILDHDNLAKGISGSMLTRFSQIYNELPSQTPHNLEAWFSLFSNEQTQPDINAIANLLGLSEDVKKQLGKDKIDKMKNQSLKVGKGMFLAVLFFLIFQIYTNLGAEGNQRGGQ